MYLRDIDFGLSDRLKNIYGYIFNAGFLQLCDSTIMHFLHYLRKQKLDSSDTRKAFITLIDESEFIPTSNDIRTDPLGILYATERFDLHQLYPLNAYEQKRLILDLIRKVLTRISDEMGWKTEKVETAYENCLQDNLIYEGLLRTPIKHPSQNFNVKIFYRVDPYVVHYFANLYKNRSSKQLARKFLGSTAVNIYSLFKFEERAEWHGEKTFRIKVDTHRLKNTREAGVIWTDHYWEVTFDELK